MGPLLGRFPRRRSGQGSPRVPHAVPPGGRDNRATRWPQARVLYMRNRGMRSFGESLSRCSMLQLFFAAGLTFIGLVADESAQEAPLLVIVRIQEGLRQLEAQAKREAVRAYYDSWRGLADGLAVVGTAGRTNRNAGYAESGNEFPLDLDSAGLYGLELGF